MADTSPSYKYQRVDSCGFGISFVCRNNQPRQNLERQGGPKTAIQLKYELTAGLRQAGQEVSFCGAICEKAFASD